jgi:hypothetical protein
MPTGLTVLETKQVKLAVKFWTCIPKVLGSNLGLVVCYSVGDFSGFPQFLRANIEVSTALFRIPTYRHLPISLEDVICMYDVETASLNRLTLVTTNKTRRRHKREDKIDIFTVVKTSNLQSTRSFLKTSCLLSRKKSHAFYENRRLTAVTISVRY